MITWEHVKVNGDPIAFESGPIVLVWYQGRARKGQLHKDGSTKRKKWWRVLLAESAYSGAIWIDVPYQGIEWYSEMNGPTVRKDNPHHDDRKAKH